MIATSPRKKTREAQNSAYRPVPGFRRAESPPTPRAAFIIPRPCPKSATYCSRAGDRKPKRVPSTASTINTIRTIRTIRTIFPKPQTSTQTPLPLFPPHSQGHPCRIICPKNGADRCDTRGSCCQSFPAISRINPPQRNHRKGYGRANLA